MDFKLSINEQENPTLIRERIGNKTKEQFSVEQKKDLLDHNNVEFKTLTEFREEVGNKYTDAISKEREAGWGVLAKDAMEEATKYKLLMYKTNMSDQRQDKKATPSLRGISGRDLNKRKGKLMDMSQQSGLISELQSRLGELYENNKEVEDRKSADIVRFRANMIKYEILEAQYKYNYKFIKAYGKKDAEEKEQLAKLLVEYETKKEALLNETPVLDVASKHVVGITKSEAKKFEARCAANEKALRKAVREYESAVSKNSIVKVFASDFEEVKKEDCLEPVVKKEEQKDKKKSAADIDPEALDTRVKIYLNAYKEEEKITQYYVDYAAELANKNKELKIDPTSSSVQDMWVQCLFKPVVLDKNGIPSKESEENDQYNKKIMEAFYNKQDRNGVIPYIVSALKDLSSIDEGKITEICQDEKINDNASEILKHSIRNYQLGRLSRFPEFKKALEQAEMSKEQYEQLVNKFIPCDDIKNAILANSILNNYRYSLGSVRLEKMSDRDYEAFNIRKNHPTLGLADIGLGFWIRDYDNTKAQRLEENEKEQLEKTYPIFAEKPELMQKLVIEGLLVHVERKEDGTFANEQAMRNYQKNRNTVKSLLSDKPEEIKYVFKSLIKDIRNFEIYDLDSYFRPTSVKTLFNLSEKARAFLLMCTLKGEGKILSAIEESVDELRKTSANEFSRITRLGNVSNFYLDNIDEIIKLAGYDRKTNTFVDSDNKKADEFKNECTNKIESERKKMINDLDASLNDTEKHVFQVTMEEAQERIHCHKVCEGRRQEYTTLAGGDATRAGEVFERDYQGFMNLFRETVPENELKNYRKMAEAYKNNDVKTLAKICNSMMDILLRLPLDKNIWRNAGTDIIMFCDRITLMFTKQNSNPEVVKLIDPVKYRAVTAKTTYLASIELCLNQRFAAIGIDSNTYKKLIKMPNPENVNEAQKGFLRLALGKKIALEQCADELRREGHSDIADLLIADHKEMPDLTFPNLD